MTVRVNIRAAANMSAIRRERRNGRDKIIVPSATLPDDVVMNGIQYPADEIAKGFATLNGTFAPLGHPMIDGQFVSAAHPEGVNIGWIGAYNENVRRENGRVFLDKVIDVARAKESDGGKAVLEAIEKGDPIHTSTGVFVDLEDAQGESFTQIARNMQFDHDAILLGEEGAATPDQGVGMLVNASGEKEQVKVINSSLDDEEDFLLERAADMATRAMELRERAPILERMKTVLSEMFGARNNPSTDERNLDMDKEQFDALSAKVNGLAENAVTKDDIATAVAEAVKPVVDAQAEIKANQQAKEQAEHEALVNKVVEAGIEGFNKEVAEKMDATALNAVLTMNAAKGQKAAPLAPGFMMNTEADESMSPLSWGVKQ